MSNEFHVKKGLIVDNLSGNNNKIVILDSIGKILPSSIDISTISTTGDVSNLQTQIDSINVQGLNGIQVVESPINTFTIAVSSDYALTSYVNSASANSYSQSVSYVNNLVPRSYINGINSTSVIDSIAISSNNSACWIVSVSGGSGLRTSQIIAITDGSNIEYAESSTPSIGTTSDLDLISDINAGQMRLVAMASAGIWNVKSIRISV